MQLLLPAHVHDLNASDDDARTPERFESQHRICDSLDAPGVLLDHVIEVFGLAQLPIDAGIFPGTFNGGCVSHTFCRW